MLAGYESDGFQMDFWSKNVFIPMEAIKGKSI